jgi:hypothetical protein
MKYKPFDLQREGYDVFLSNRKDTIESQLSKHALKPGMIEDIVKGLKNNMKPQVLNRYHEKQLKSAEAEMKACEDRHKELWETLEASLEELFTEYGVESTAVTYRMIQLKDEIAIHKMHLEKQNKPEKAQGKNAS